MKTPVLVLALFIAACDDGVVDLIEQSGCDSLVPEYCAMPWPSDRFLRDDASTTTGYRIHYEDTTLARDRTGEPWDYQLYHRLDGFSPASHFVVLFDRAPDLSRAAHHDSVERSLDPASPIVVLDLDTGERVAHWVESDHQVDRLVLIRPAARLAENRSYGVAIRDLTGDDGNPIEPSPAFVALRDDSTTTSPAVEARRPSYRTLFARLEASGVDIADLQLAWWFHTGSGQSSRGDLLFMREDALARLGPDGIGCTVISAEDGYKGSYRHVEGTVTVPSYMDSPRPPARIVRDRDGKPTFVENVEVSFAVILPNSVGNATGGPRPGPMAMFGHGLLGTGTGSLSSGLRTLAEEFGSVVGATDWTGMAQEDSATLALALVNLNYFAHVAERLQQGMINQIAVHRTLAGVCRQNQAFHAADGTILIDPDQRYFIGGSQGGIYGATLLTISPDVERGVMVVGGSNYPLMIERSTNWPMFEQLFATAYRDRIDRVFLLNHLQQIWDYSDPASYLPFTTSGLDSIGAKKMLYIVAHNDAQVPNVASDLAARTAGLPVIDGSVRQPFGLERAPADYDGSGFIAIDMGDAEVPYDNRPPPSDHGGHGSVGFSAAAKALMADFLRPDGRIISPSCEGVCDPY
ncbi:MAG: hypothetical protein MJE77_40265 [Proteobacteria bacterium]|nr:hypothetical protein [Pseudomonadota bacterium]